MTFATLWRSDTGPRTPTIRYIVRRGLRLISGLIVTAGAAIPTVGHTEGPKAKPIPAAQSTAWPEAMPLAERMERKLVPARGFVSTGGNGGTIFSGNGKLTAELSGALNDDIVFHHEKIMQPWERPFAAPKIAPVLPEVKRLILAGQYREGLELSLHAATAAGMPPGTMNHGLISPYRIHLEQPAAGVPAHYLRTVDFESGETNVYWTDDRGEWARHGFVSRADDVAVEQLMAPNGAPLNVTVSVVTDARVRDEEARENEVHYERDTTVSRFVVTGHFRPEFGNRGFTGVTRVAVDGGTVKLVDGKIVITGARSATLLTRITDLPELSQAKVDALASAVSAMPPDYTALLARQRALQAPIIDRVRMRFTGSEAQRGLSSEELLRDQHLRIGYAPALLEQLFDMGRYWLLAEGTGDDPSIAGHLNINVNLQIAPAAMAALPEASETFSRWMEGLMPDSRVNAQNLFGARGAFVTVHPDQEQGVMYHFAYNWPHHYWISAGGWAYSPLWDYYLTTGDAAFLRDHIVPELKEFALFYEDFLTEKDRNGNYIFVPSYSPENWPSNSDGTPTVINAVMDISVCKEVLTHLIQASEILGSDAGDVPKWKAMLAHMPPYLLDTDGALKEWAWPTLDENQDHRHISHLYGVWPGDEITPDTTPELAKAAWLADRKRAQGNASGHGISHRALSAARLKDDYLVNMELKQFLEQGYVGPTLRTSHNPYTGPMPDQQGSIPTLMMEMLLYTRPGQIELLPALPETLRKGDVQGLLARTFVRVDDLAWDLDAHTIDVSLTSRKTQQVVLTVRQGIVGVTATQGVLVSQPAAGETTCTLRLREGVPVTLHLRVGDKHPSDWVLAEAKP